MRCLLLLALALRVCLASAAAQEVAKPEPEGTQVRTLVFDYLGLKPLYVGQPCLVQHDV